ncbi:MAG: polyketide synthase dehydratase domain-containing protein, partial [Desulfobacterales bacterium]|nr:polyketide synthase dehydratase domain-containing protein [Desulfobacterales bacterium]
EQGSNSHGILGSPFHLDAAFHAACVWGQRYEQVVAFPVGFDHRTIYEPTRPGEIYFSRVIAVETSRDLLIFDIWIYNQQGNLCESVGRVHMKDVSAGRMKPPRWITEF